MPPAEQREFLRGEMQAHYRGRGGEFYRIRPYEPFESARHVDWKATAHTGELQVREFAREQEHLLEIFLDLETPEALHDWFERAVGSSVPPLSSKRFAEEGEMRT